MEMRRYELATLAAARRPASSYCSLAPRPHILAEQLGEPVLAIAATFAARTSARSTSPVMELAERVVDDATAIEDLPTGSGSYATSG